MNYRTRSAGSILAAVLTVVVPRAIAQQTAVTTPPSDDKDESVVLSPFVVNASEDAGSYNATSTLAGTRVRTDLRDTASAISVVTQQFLQDTGARNEADLLVYTPSTEVGGIGGNFSGAAGGHTFTESLVNPSTRVRGLDSADNTRNYYLTDIPFDTYNVGRVDLQRGPNSILFGVGSPAGIINASTNDAGYKNSVRLENRFDQFGSVRDSVEANYVLVPDVLAIRVAGLVDDEKFEQKPAFQNSKRLYGAIRFDPKLFKTDSAHTSIRVNAERGTVSSNMPRDLPPVDDINRWFQTGTDVYGNLGLSKLTINQYSLTNANASGIPMPGIQGSSLGNATFQLNGTAEGHSYWPDIINYYQVANGNSPLKTITAQPNVAKGLPDASGNHGVAGIASPIYRPYAIPDYSSYAGYIGTAGTAGGYVYPQKVIPGGAYFDDVVLQDPSVFDFYHKLLDGPNKHEWQNWKAYNLTVDQTFFSDRLAFEFGFDHQYYNSGNQQWLAGQDYNINVDVNQTYADGTPNPNVGRAYVANAESNDNFESTSVRDTARFTVTGDLRAEDLFGKGKLADILGHHVLTGLYDRSKQGLTSDQYALYATTPGYIVENSLPSNGVFNVNSINSNRDYEWLEYIGPSMLNASSAAGANLSNITSRLSPPTDQTIRNFDATWNKPTDPSAPGYVDPKAPYSYTDLSTGSTTNSIQSQNPANYVGWSDEHVTWMSSSNPLQKPSLITAANRVSTRDISKGLTWQGYLLGGDLVPVYGWRKDNVTTIQTQGIANTNTGIVPMDFADDDSVTSRTDIRGTSHTWGAVYHLPRSITDHLPGGTTLGLFYNHGNNFEAESSRLSLSGLPIPNPQGLTKEYGIQFSTLHDKLTLKVSHFNTVVHNATLSGTNGNDIAGLGNSGYVIANGVQWGYGWATALQDGIEGKTPNSNYWDAAGADGLPKGTAAELAAYNDYNLNGGTYIDSGGGKHTYVGANAITKAWVNIPLPSVYFAGYGQSPAIDPTIAAKTGQLSSSYGAAGPNDASGPNVGGGSNFGNHQITVDNLSKGEEIELTAQPVKNWNITVNFSHVKATHVNIDEAAQEFIGKMTAFMNGPGGQVRMWYNGGPALGQTWNSAIVAPFTVELDSLGHEAPEVSPWRLNLVSTYTFDHGPIKGLFIGGGMRIDAARIIGYNYDASYKNVNSDDPNYAAVAAVTQGGLNVNDPVRGKNEEHVDAWIGYERKLTHKLHWRIQFNMRNVGEHDHLIAAQDNPGNPALNIAPSIALARISEGMTWQLTNSIEF